MAAPMAMPLWNSELGAHGDRRWPKSEFTGPRTGQRDGSEASTRLARPRKRSSERHGPAPHLPQPARRAHVPPPPAPPQPAHLPLARRAIALAGDPAPDAGAASGRARLGAERLPELGVPGAPAAALLPALPPPLLGGV